MLIFVAIFLPTVIKINPSYGSVGSEIMFEPINIFAILFVYSIPFVSYLTVGIIHLILSRKQKKKKGKEENNVKFS